MARRRTGILSASLIVAVACYGVLCKILPSSSLALALVSDLGFVLVQALVLGLCILAHRHMRLAQYRWLWLFMAIWVGCNLWGDSLWAYYELVRGVEPPTPGLHDAGYLASYLAAHTGILYLVYRVSGRLRAGIVGLDSLLFVAGVFSLSWTLVLRPLLDLSSSTPEYWMNLAYPLAGLLVILAIVSLFLSVWESRSPWPRLPVLLLCVAFLSTTGADCSYFALMALGADYGPGSILDVFWLLAFAVVGVGAILEIGGSSRPSKTARSQHTAALALGVPGRAPGKSASLVALLRTAFPYLSLPLPAVALAIELYRNRTEPTLDLAVPLSAGFLMGTIVLIRQFIVLRDNRLLTAQLSEVTLQLQERVASLSDLTQRLESLNRHFERLQRARSLPEILNTGVQLACSYEKSPGGWITLFDEEGKVRSTVTWGNIDQTRTLDHQGNQTALENGTLRMAALASGGRSLGMIYVVAGETRPAGPDMLPAIAANIATAIDNARRYEEAVDLAEKDSLTGLYNHRGIYKRLAGELLRAQRNGDTLSVILADLDDFKILNDTFGHLVGDNVLTYVAGSIRSVLRHSDLAGRIGGDELLVVLPHTDSEGASGLGRRLLTAVSTRPFVATGGQQVPVRLSLGVATYPTDALSLGELVETADANLYLAKQLGGLQLVAGSRMTSSDAAPADIKSKQAGYTAAGPEDSARSRSAPPEVRLAPQTSGHAPAAQVQDLLGLTGRLLGAVGMKDHYTRRHSEHVLLYSLALGEALGLPEEDLQTLHYAALLHDVGKIGVPDEILRLAGPLTPDQADLVHRHPNMSADIVNDLPRLARVAEAVKAHHEHYDGTGYPEELTGDNIPLLARILAVADAYSAMTLERPYRKSLTRKEARRELLKASGSQLDPVLVRKFLDILDAQEARLARVRGEAG